MIDLLDVKIHPSGTRLATLLIRYHDLVLNCELALYKTEKLWVRMPELWVSPHRKQRAVYWDDPVKSEHFQVMMLAIIEKKAGITLEKAIEWRKKFSSNRKKKTAKKEPVTVA